jgi:hypothetical protein
MRVVALLLIVAACASCRREESPQARAAGGERAAKAPVRTDTSAAAQEKSDPELLLETKNIRVEPSGFRFYIQIKDIGNLDAILADIATLPASEAKDRALESVFCEVAKSDPARAREFLKQWSDGIVPAWLGVAQEIARTLGKSDPAAAREFILQEVPTSMQIDVWGALIEVLPPADQVAVFRTLPDGQCKLQIAAAMIHPWLATDPAAVAAWVDEFAVGMGREELFNLGKPLRSSKSKENRDPQAWRAAFHAATTPEARTFFARNAVEHAERAQKQELMAEFAEKLPDVKSKVPDRPWDDDPAAWVKTLSPEATVALPPEEAFRMIQYWSQQNAPKAFEWAVAQGRPEAAEALARLYDQDPKEAVALAPKMPAGEHRDKALSSICWSAAHRGDETSARALLPLISDPQLRDQMSGNVERNMKPRAGGK